MKLLPGLFSASCLFYCLFFIAGNPASFAQPVLKYEQLTSENGLSENVVYCVFQDSKGFIWAGTDFGLNRFDGYRFKNYFKNNNDSTTLSNNSVSCIEENTDGRLWVGTFAGLNLVDPVTGKTERIFIPGKGLNYGVSSLYLADKDHLLLFLGNAVYLYAINDRAAHVVSVNSHVSITKQQFYKLAGGEIAMEASANGERGFFIIDNGKYTGQFRAFRDIFPFAQTMYTNHYYADGNGNHYFFEYPGSLKVYSKTGDLICSLKAGANKTNFPEGVTQVTEMSSGDLWILANNGLFVLDHTRTRIDRPVLSGTSESLVANLHLNCIMNSRNGNTWLGTFGEGLLKFQNQEKIFQHIPLPDIRTNEIRGMIMGIYQWSGNKVAATGRGGYTFFQEGKMTGFKTESQLSSDEIAEATTGMKLSDLNGYHQQKLKELYRQGKLLPHFFLLHNDTTVINFSNGCMVHHPHSTKTVFEDQAFNMATKGDYYWFSTPGGLRRLDKKTFMDTVYSFQSGKSNNISETWTYYVAAGDSNHIWIGTKGGGLNRFDIHQNRFTHYTVSDGLPDNVIYVVVPDRQGRLWLTTNKGVSVFNIRQKTFTNFSKRDGLLNTEYNRMSGVLAQDNYIYFAGTAGIDFFDPEKIQSNAKPAVYFSSIMVNSAETSGDQRMLKHFQNNISIFYTSNDFNRPGLVYYRYRLKQAQSWTRVQGINSVSFNALQPGSYNFEVQSSYNNLDWSESAVYGFTIKIPWWQGWWFYTLLGLAVAVAFYLFYHYRISHLKKVHHLRTKISRDLHDEVGATLSSIHVYSSVAARAMNKDSEKAIDALQHINASTRHVMENMSDIVWAINTGDAKETTLEGKLKNYGYDLLTPLNIRCSYVIDKEAEKKLTNMEARKNILLIAKEAMNNIARHSHATEATIKLHFDSKNLRIEINDNGDGFEAVEKRTGNGMQNMRRRAEELGGTFKLVPGKDKGTLILCTIPLAIISN